MIPYQEYKNSRYTLEIHTDVISTQIKLFDRDDEILYMNYLAETPIVNHCINDLIKILNNDLYKHNKED